MLDIKFIRENIDIVRDGIRKKNETDNLDEILRLDVRRREVQQQLDALKNRRNIVSDEVAALKKRKEDAAHLISEMATLKLNIQSLEVETAEVEQSLAPLLLTVPNVPHSSVPTGKTAEDNVPIFSWGKLEEFDFVPVPHWEIASKHKIIDFERGSRVAGAGFPFYVGKGARLQRALINFFLDEAAEKGYTEIEPPIVVNESSARGTGQIPDKEDLMYTAERDGLYMIPTAEVPVTNFHREEVLPEQQLSIKYCAYTPCFRREAGSYGKDVRGLNRLHQFDKVELVKFVHPDKSYDELESLRADAEQLLQKLQLPYRVLLMCAGDMGFSQAKKYDLEVWSVGQKRWLEVSSVSNFESFQARRMNIRFRPTDGGKPEIVHTLNGSALALPRIVATILENNQTPEGKVIIPKVLQKYTDFSIIG
ncbi:MAG: serine--tRNA ligase [Ignavibacteriales bacterium]|nr:serine--tRNA ligase [Ignavibacteriales bacterium]